MNRKQAGYLLAEELEKRELSFDLVLGIPRGGIVPAGIIARYFDKELDILLSRKISSPSWDEPLIGAVAPDGKVIMPEHRQ
ncbi:MAG: phosphoribosyltransferase, partial [Syntrophomonadaceae bacterium]|nr:phosphoribosyltransferase [Syntrophomonadaceae bacterium]